MARYAVVDQGEVTNVVEWDGETEWKPESGRSIACPDHVGIGWTHHPRAKEHWWPPAEKESIDGDEPERPDLPDT